MSEPGQVESENESAPRIEISPEQLTSYLLREDTIKGGPTEFPNFLTLDGNFENYMRGLHGERPQVTEVLAAGMSLEGEGEVAKSIYYDPDTDSITTAETVPGQLATVNSSFMRVLLANKLPLMEMHTHSSESWPSIADYQPMLFGSPASNGRGVRAIAVLCPNVQILALATDSTPILTQDQLRQLLAEQGELNRLYEGKEGKYLKTLTNRLDAVINYMNEAFSRREENKDEQLKRDLERIKEGSEPEEVHETAEDLAEVLARTSSVSSKLIKRYSKYSDRVFTKLQLQFARDMGIKLYTSADFKNFIAFETSTTTQAV